MRWEAQGSPSLFVSFDCDSSSEEYYTGRYMMFSSRFLFFSVGLGGQSRVCRANCFLFGAVGPKKTVVTVKITPRKINSLLQVHRPS